MAIKISQELMEEMKKETQRMRLEFEEKNRLLRQEFLSQQLCAKPLVTPIPRSTKGSYATPTTSGEDVIGQISQCELLIEDDIFPQVVTIRKVFQEVTTLHNVPLPLMW